MTTSSPIALLLFAIMSSTTPARAYENPVPARLQHQITVTQAEAFRLDKNDDCMLSVKGADTHELLQAFYDVQSVCSACHHSFRVEQGGAK